MTNADQPWKYHMNRSDREITSEEKMNDIILKGKYLILSLCSDNEPYIVTLSYGYDPERDQIFFHTAPEGLKLDMIRKNPRCSATIIDDLGYCHGDCSHKYRSVVLFGELSIIEDMMTKKNAMKTMFDHLESDPDGMKERFLSSDEAYEGICIIKMIIQHMTGKESI